VNEGAFYRWRKELARRDAEPAASFVPVQVSADHPGAEESRIEIVLVGGRRVRLSGRVDRQALADVLAAVESQAC